MSTFMIPVILKLFSLLVFTYIFWRKFRPPRPQGQPLPGPPGLPVIGNAFQFPEENPWKQLKIWADKYGPIYQISAFGKTFIVLGSDEVCNDLLRARGDIYSDRHYITVLRDEIHLPIIKYGDTWRRQRKFFHFAQLQSQASNPHYIDALTKNVRRTVDELLDAYSTASAISSSSPPLRTARQHLNLKIHWHHILEAYICGVVSQLAYGYQVKTSTEKYVRDWVEFYNEFEKAAEPARYAVNVFPWLRFVPSWLGPWKRSGKKYLDGEKEMIHRMFLGVGKRMGRKSITRTYGVAAGGVAAVKGNSEAEQAEEKEPYSIAKLYYLDPSKWTSKDPSPSSPCSNLTAHEAAYTLGAFIEASMAGTPAALKLFFQAMLWYPEWQDRIYDQICEVCGRVSDEETQQQHQSSAEGNGSGNGDVQRPRMPELSDTPQLPVIRAVIKEMLRWRPTLPGGFPHRLMRDDLYTPTTTSFSPDNPPSSSSNDPTKPRLPYLLKADTLLLWHHYTLTRNPSLYPSPETFNPTRFLDAQTYPQTTRLPLTQYPTCTLDAAFGFGRRMCPGTRMAEDMMVLMIAWVVTACVVERKRKEGGDEFEFERVPWDEYDEGRPTRPTGFEFVLVERKGWRGRMGA